MESHEEKFNCYEVLKIKQFKQNTEYNARIEAQQNAMSGIPEMQNRTDTMLPINMFGGYANMIPNELRGYQVKTSKEAWLFVDFQVVVYTTEKIVFKC